MAAACAIQEIETQYVEVFKNGKVQGESHTNLDTEDGRGQKDPSDAEDKIPKEGSQLKIKEKQVQSAMATGNERRSGKLPTRKRSIPFKFRDYRNPDLLNENGEEAESDGEPDKEFQPVNKKIAIPKIPGKRGRGRPRKNPMPIIYTDNAEGVSTTPMAVGNTIQIQDMNFVIIQAIGDAQNSTFQHGREVRILPAPPVIKTTTPDINAPQAPTETAVLPQGLTGAVTIEQGPEGEIVMAPGPGGDVTTNQSQDNSAAESEGQSGEVTLSEGQSGDGNNELIEGDKAPQTSHRVIAQKRGGGRKKGEAAQQTFECGVCLRMFSSKGNLKTHEKIHLGDKPFHCELEGCGKSFRSNEALRRHKMSHLGIKPFQCEICQKNFSSNISLQEHVARHTDTKPHQCHVCLRNFRQISCLRRHLVTHSSEMPFQCKICNRKFSQNMYLRSHMKMHTGERPFKCMECGKSFAHQSDLIRHKIIHTGEKPFVCEVCHSRFSDPSSKRRHEREHVGQKPYVCQLCFESFKRAGQLKAHLSRKHTNQKDDVRVVRTSTGTLQFIYKDGSCESAERTAEIIAEGDASQSEDKQKKIVKLIKDLNSSIVHQYQINLPPHDYLASDDDKTDSANQEEELVAVQGVVMETFQDQNKDDSTITELPEVSQVQNLPISTYQNGDNQVITIAEVLEDGQSKGGNVPVEYLQIIEELVPDSLEQQIVEVHYQDSANGIADITESVTSTTSIGSLVDSTSSSQDNVLSQEGTMVPQDVISETPPNQILNEAVSTATAVEPTNVDYVTNPDFSSQQYYNWLSSFTEVCKVMPMPLEVSLFQKISQVHKTLSDVMATPSGVIADKDNFKILMNISSELNTIKNEHLFYVMQRLDTGSGTEAMQ